MLVVGYHHGLQRNMYSNALPTLTVPLKRPSPTFLFFGNCSPITSTNFFLSANGVNLAEQQFLAVFAILGHYIPVV